MNVPTAAEIRTWSRLPFDDYDYAEPSSGTDPLDILIARAAEYVGRVTGRSLDTSPDPNTLDVPDELSQTAAEAIQRRVEQMVIKSQEDEVETAADFDLIKSFSAGSYSETRRDAADAAKAKAINAWPLLDEMLWALATEDARDDWREKWGDVVPAFSVTEVDWHGTLLPPSPTEL